QRCPKQLSPSPQKQTNSNESTPKKNTLSSPRHGTPSRRGRRGVKRRLGMDEDIDEGEWRNADEEDIEPRQLYFRPERQPGPQLDRTAKYTPLELFQLFFSTTVIDLLVKNTNRYALNKHKNHKWWVPVTAADMYSFIALVIYMGIVPLKTFKDFWRVTKLYNLPFPGSVMSCHRFTAILGSLHLNDPEVEAANDEKKGMPGFDKLCKVRPLYEGILQACHTFFQPHQHISIDERMVASKARIGFKQYIKNKPTKWGFKLYVLADSACGYTLNFFVYGGKEGEPSGKGQSYDVVMRLLKIPFLGTGYKLYVDNFYTSPTLFCDLLERKIAACGTIRINVPGYPQTKKNDISPKEPRGTVRWLRRGNLLFLKWLDCRVVNMCSTIHRAHSNKSVKRKVKVKQGRWTEKDVLVPECITDYNKNMGGVDLSDALIGYYNVLHKTRKWYKTLFYHFVDIATVNAFILHKELCKMQKKPQLTQKKFREKLILSLTEIGSIPRRAPVEDHNLPHRGTYCRRKCVLCKNKSPVYCTVCQKTLCLNAQRNCYTKWHKKNNISKSNEIRVNI
uniref:PiggyBac transposable element-derived protein domain-containing protein n=1 Tax=Sphaeramia orbicularis TaxID=375764 RepID=A0A672YCG2_9TELE